MTKERRLAIEMWEQIAEALENEHDLLVVFDIKEKFLHKHNLRWMCGCWFCQYVRLDGREMPSREGIPTDCNGCQRCPLYRERADILDDEECGCTEARETLWKQVVDDGNISAAKRIVELLKGGHNESR